MNETYADLFGEPEPHVPESVSPLMSDLREKFAEIFTSAKFRRDLTDRCESPIEIDLGAAIVRQAAERFQLQPQFKIGRFRYDFAINDLAGNLVLLIECDGAEFHSTPEQIANDAAKDKAAADIKIPLIRVTGKEIYRSPDVSAQEIVDLALKLIEEK